MPIRADLMPLYPGGSIASPEWQEIRAEIRARSGDRCEGSSAYPDCRVPNGDVHPVTGSIVVLTVAHLDQDPANNGEPGNRPNLRHWCQRCHNTHDAPFRAANAWRTIRTSWAVRDLFCDDPEARP